MVPDSSVISSDRRRGNGYKLKYRKFHVKLIQNCFPASVVKQVQVAQRGCGVFILMIFKTQLDMALNNLL